MKNSLITYLENERDEFLIEKKKSKKGYLIERLKDEDTREHGYLFYERCADSLNAMIKILNECEFIKKKGNMLGKDLMMKNNKIYYNERFELLDFESKYTQIISELSEQILYG